MTDNTKGTMTDNTISIFIRRDGKIILRQNEQEVVLSAAQVLATTETFIAVIDKAMREPVDDDEVRSIDPNSSSVN